MLRDCDPKSHKCKVSCHVPLRVVHVLQLSEVAIDVVEFVGSALGEYYALLDVQRPK